MIWRWKWKDDSDNLTFNFYYALYCDDIKCSQSYAKTLGSREDNQVTITIWNSGLLVGFTFIFCLCVFKFYLLFYSFFFLTFFSGFISFFSFDLNFQLLYIIFFLKN